MYAFKEFIEHFKSRNTTVFVTFLDESKAFDKIYHGCCLKMKTNNSVNIIVDKCVLNKVTSIKYLGVIIDHKPNWIEHISYVKKKFKRHWNTL